MLGIGTGFLKMGSSAFMNGRAQYLVDQINDTPFCVLLSLTINHLKILCYTKVMFGLLAATHGRSMPTKF